MLDRRDRAFVERDVDAYLDLWTEDCLIEGHDHVIQGQAELRLAIEKTWRSWEPIYMGVLSLGVAGDWMHHEFASVWERRGQTIRRLVTGMSVAEVSGAGRWIWLREYFDPSGVIRPSVLERPEIAALEPEAGFERSESPPS